MWKGRRDFVKSIGVGAAGTGLSLSLADCAPAEALTAQRDRLAPDASEIALPALPDGWHILSQAVLAGGVLGLLGVNADLRQEWRRGPSGEMLGDPFALAGRALAGLWTFDGETLATGPTFPLLTPFPIFDRFPDGRWLVASIRSGEANARLLATDGSELSRFRLGDGIMHLKVDSASRIWVGWFDEGVFGNDTWRVPGLEWPPAAYGLAAFDATGALVAKAEGAPTGSEIADCYALNVVGDQPWACTYSEFPISTYEAQTGWRWRPTRLSGTRAIAVGHPYVLAAGGYGDDGDRVELLRIDDQRIVPMGVWRLPIPVGFPQRVDLVDAREGQLHTVSDGVWRRWSIDNFLSSTGDVRSSS